MGDIHGILDLIQSEGHDEQGEGHPLLQIPLHVGRETIKCFKINNSFGRIILALKTIVSFKKTFSLMGGFEIKLKQLEVRELVVDLKGQPRIFSLIQNNQLQSVGDFDL